MAQRWSLKEDYIVCKFVYEHDVFISAQDLHCLVLELKENGFDRGKVAVNKRVYNYQYLLTNREATVYNRFIKVCILSLVTLSIFIPPMCGRI